MTTPPWSGCRYEEDGNHRKGTRTITIGHNGNITTTFHCWHDHVIDHIETNDFSNMRDLTPNEIIEFAQELSDRTHTTNP